MPESQARSIAKIYFYLMTLLFVGVQALLFTEVELVTDEDIIGAAVFTMIPISLIALTIKGHRWSKWTLCIFLILFGLLFLYAGFEIPSLKIKLVALYYLLFGLLPLTSRRLKHITITPVDLSTRSETMVTVNLSSPSVPSEQNSNHTNEYPPLVHRVKAMVIDFLFVLIMVFTFVLINSIIALDTTWITVVTAILLLTYEPFSIAYSSTIGQKMMKLQVRNAKKPEQRISLFNAYIRWIAKVFFGWSSFVTIHFNDEKKAIHDMAASSVVVCRK